MSAQDYSVSFGYGAYDGTYYTQSRPHRGNDRPTPTGTEILIGGTVIGLTGNTGLTSGPHLHTQAGTDKGCQTTVDPTPYEFRGGTVVMTGNASQWGNFIIIEVVPGKAYICYAHLSKILVSQGQTLKEEEMASPDMIKLIIQHLLYRPATQADLDAYNGWTLEAVFRDVSATPERNDRIVEREAALKNASQPNAALEALKTALKNILK